ncbi:acid-sensing ion channel 5 [Brachionus plicatilis]|uniref:Acid-sensing ion channel 5 n=1 Tax=Brachionus plicatilis TaxID=10195 RepID=A0A3M7QP79_BRAPC|nr:acid-sensing ion channel 5 [Brachionus plicatilis]
MEHYFFNWNRWCNHNKVKQRFEKLTFYSYPYSTSVEIYESYLDEFPAVSICNLNPFDTTNQKTQVYFGQILNMKINSSSQSPAIYEVRRSLKLLISNLVSNLMTKNFQTDIKIVNNFDDMVLSCYFNGQKCDSRDFQRFFAFGYGQCFTFNKKINDTTGIKKTSKTGPESGLTLELFTGFSGQQQDYFIEKSGIFLAVHNNSANPAMSFEGIKLSVGKSVEIGIKRTFYRKLSEPFSKCREDTSKVLNDDPEFYKRTVKSGFYTRKNCFEICLLFKFIIPACNCTDPRINLSLTCDKECPVSCDTMEYTYQQSYSDYPTNTLMVNVFYQDLSSKFVKKTALISLQDLVASIGGLLGLFLGCSVLTLIEPIAFIIELVCELFMVKIKTSPSESSSFFIVLLSGHPPVRPVCFGQSNCLDDQDGKSFRQTVQRRTSKTIFIQFTIRKTFFINRLSNLEKKK